MKKNWNDWKKAFPLFGATLKWLLNEEIEQEALLSIWIYSKDIILNAHFGGKIAFYYPRCKRLMWGEGKKRRKNLTVYIDLMLLRFRRLNHGENSGRLPSTPKATRNCSWLQEPHFLVPGGKELCLCLCIWMTLSSLHVKWERSSAENRAPVLTTLGVRRRKEIRQPVNPLIWGDCGDTSVGEAFALRIGKQKSLDSKRLSLETWSSSLVCLALLPRTAHPARSHLEEQAERAPGSVWALTCPSHPQTPASFPVSVKTKTCCEDFGSQPGEYHLVLGSRNIRSSSLNPLLFECRERRLWGQAGSNLSLILPLSTYVTQGNIQRPQTPPPNGRLRVALN